MSKIRFLSFIAALLMLAFSGCSGDAPAASAQSIPVTESSAAPEPSTETSIPSTTMPKEPEQVSILDFLEIAAAPVGSTMYVWGGGWNEADTGAGIEAVTLGLSERWAAFAKEQDSGYNYKDHRYQIHDGLDCSGYVGWAVYNVMETESGGEGYVSSSTGMAQALADRGLGEYISREDMDRWLPGDIMSMKGHVWISLGMCGDGSVLLLHSSPPGVIFCGTALADGSDSQAVKLAQTIMSTHYPDWYARYPDCSRPASYLEKSSAMRWNTNVLADEEGIRQMSAEQVVNLLFSR
ncbi:MAG: hypothetical protein IJ351_06390 [Oscillospiraceae bacterium]|nr:hypothetical protein [Oscillospiraceae bacterium]